MELKRVVVTGLGAITPLGNTLPETWEGIINGKSGAGPITQFDASKFKTQFACEVKGFDPLTVMDRKEARKCDRYSLFAIDAAKQAIDDAAMDLDKEDKNRIGVIFRLRYRWYQDIRRGSIEDMRRSRTRSVRSSTRSSSRR